VTKKAKKRKDKPGRKHVRTGRPRGRPPSYDPAVCLPEICEWIAQGGYLVDYCAQPGKPSRTQVDRWEQADSAFAERIRDARLRSVDALHEQALKIADEPLVSEVVTEVTRWVESDDGPKEMVERRVVRGDDVGARTLRVRTRLAVATKYAPAKLDVTHKGKLTLEELVCQSMFQGSEDADGGS